MPSKYEKYNFEKRKEWLKERRRVRRWKRSEKMKLKREVGDE